MSIGELFSKSLRRLKEQGPRNLWQRTHAYLFDYYRERGLGIETRSWLEWQGVNSDALHVDYEPLSFWHIEKVLAEFTITADSAVFLDYGSGKGRIVAAAASLPFRRVMGIDIQEGLSQIAQKNFERCRSKLTCRHAQFVTTDATSYELPDDVTHVFLFNPFGGSVLRSVLTQIHESWQRAQRRIELAYVIPATHENVLDDCAWFAKVRRLKLPHWQHLQFLLYVTRETKQ